jgi:hypothetical protein
MRKLTITEMLAIGQRDSLRVFYAWCFWGNPQHLDRFLQAYAVERARIEASKQGHRVSEQTLADGSIKLTVQVGGAA